MAAPGFALGMDDHRYATVARLDTPGEIDASFGSNGAIVIPLADAQHPSQAFAVIALGSARVLAAGVADDESGTIEGLSGMLVRLQSDLVFLDGF